MKRYLNQFLNKQERQSEEVRNARDVLRKLGALAIPVFADAMCEHYWNEDKMSEKKQSRSYSDIPVCCDHADRCVDKIYFHPYNLFHRDIKELMAFCEAKGYEMSFSGSSYYYPGRTFCGILTKKKKDN